MWASLHDLGRPAEDVYFNTHDGLRLNGWFFPGNSDSGRSQRVILLLHGNAGNISSRLIFYDAFLATGVSVLAVDYRGFGRSEGQPSEEGTYRDAQAAIQWLSGKGFAAGNIIALGESLGGGVASELALREPIGGVVLHNTFTSIPDIGGEIFPWLPVRRLSSIRYETVAKLPRLKIPVMIMHSRADGLIGFHHAERNFAAANDPKLFWEVHGDHNSTLDAGRERYVEGLNTFLALLEGMHAFDAATGSD